MGASTITLLSLLSLVAHTALALAETSSVNAAPADDFRAFVPFEALVRVKRTSSLHLTSQQVDPAVRHAHFARRNRGGGLSHDSHQRRQVANPRDAAKRWEHRGAKRATASSVPVYATCNNSVGQYGQCGGIGYTGDTCCSSGWTCTVSDAYYSQCRPAATTCTNAFYSTCGGSSSPGVATCCPAGSACVAASEYFSQCLPGATTPQPWTMAPVATPTPTPTSTQAATTTAAAPAPTCTGTGLAAWSQCGNPAGGWATLSCCVSGYSCQKVNDYYYQCLASNPFNVVSPIVSVATSAVVAPIVTNVVAPVITIASQVVSAVIPTSTVVPPIAVPVCAGMAAPYGQCGGLAWLGATCCPTGNTCQASNIYYSQCLPGTAAPPASVAQPSSAALPSVASSASKSATTTTPIVVVPTISVVVPTTSTKPASVVTSSTKTSSAAPQPTSPATCVLLGQGSDGCTPYSVTPAGVVLPLLTTFPSGGHVNFMAIPCNQYSIGETYRKPGADWTPRSFGTNFDPNNNQPGGKYIGKSVYDFGLAAAAFPNGFCTIWTQVSMYNQHWGEGGQPPVCSANCLI